MWKATLSKWDEVSIDLYKLYYDLGEKRLHEILDESEKITTRSYALMGLVVPVGSFLIPFLNDKASASFPFWLGILVFLLLMVVIGKMIQNISARNIWYSGTEPIEIVKDEFATPPDLEKDEPLKANYLSELSQIQYKIEQNKVVNKKRIESFKTSLFISCACYIILGLAYYLTKR
jgi:hypothetical protein